MAQSVDTREVDLLNQLLMLTRDSIVGYREAAAEIDDRAMQRCFLRRAADRQNIAERLEEVIESLGAEPVDSGSRLGMAHRVFLDLREMFSAGDTTAMHEVARGESFLRSRYERALKSGVLSSRARDAVHAAYGSVWSGVRAVHGLDPFRLHARPHAM